MKTINEIQKYTLSRLKYFTDQTEGAKDAIEIEVHTYCTLSLLQRMYGEVAKLYADMRRKNSEFNTTGGK